MTNKVEYRLGFASDITIQSANSLRGRICQILDRQDFGSLVIMFSSDGGSTDQSLALFNFIHGLHVPVRMHAVGHVGSSAIPVFLAGSTRSSVHLARFFFHEYHWEFIGRQTLNRIDEATKRLQNDIELSREIIKTRTQVPAEILQALDGRSPSAVLSPEDAKSFGVVDNVCNLSKTGVNGISVAVWTAH